VTKTKSWRVLLALLATLTMVAAACGDDDDDAAPADGTTTAASGDTTTTAAVATTTVPAATVSVGLVYDIGGRGDQSFNDAAARGLEQGKTELGVEFSEASPNDDGSNRAELLQLQADTNKLVVGVGFLFADAINGVALDNPEVNFAVVDGVPAEDAAPNLAMLLFAEHEGSFLVGAAAALKSESGHVGFIGGVNIDLIHKFEAGFTAGAKHVNPDIVVDVEYITEPPDFDGFNAPDRAKEIALAMYDDGADIVYHAAGGSGGGLFEAAKEFSEGGDTKVWAIGVDSDQYLTASADVQEYILTSMLKRVDVAVFETIKAANGGTFAPGFNIFNLEVDGVGYATSGGFVDDITADLEELKSQIISGEITVPETVA
jgi:basic membrane protein A and related proteins